MKGAESDLSSLLFASPQRRAYKSTTVATQPPPPSSAINLVVPSHALHPRVVKKERSSSAPLTPPSSEHSYDHQPPPQWSYVSFHPYPHRMPFHPARPSPPSSSTLTASFVHAPPPLPPHSVPSHPRQTPSPPLPRHSPTQINHHYHPYYNSFTLAPILSSNERNRKENSNDRTTSSSTRLPSPSLLFPELGLSYRLPPPPYQPKRGTAGWDGRGGEFGAEGGLLKALGF